MQTAFLFAASSGSSPHTWGIPVKGAHYVDEARFIPTYVGHTFDVPKTLLVTPVHPHIRGAYSSAPPPQNGHSGSSPHTWGILEIHRCQHHPGRFIPTYVGHTGRSLSRQRATSVHPHIRGAYPVTLNVRWVAVGSSPHTWGIRNGTISHLRHHRFIPTYVGHTTMVP